MYSCAELRNTLCVDCTKTRTKKKKKKTEKTLIAISNLYTNKEQRQHKQQIELKQNKNDRHDEGYMSNYSLNLITTSYQRESEFFLFFFGPAYSTALRDPIFFFYSFILPLIVSSFSCEFKIFFLCFLRIDLSLSLSLLLPLSFRLNEIVEKCEIKTNENFTISVFVCSAG